MVSVNNVLEGMKIIYKYVSYYEAKEHKFSANQDQIWCGEYNADIMSDNDLSVVEEFGWFEDKKLWSIYI